MTNPRYIIGIDLGTTHTAMAFVDTKSADPRVQIFAVPQLIAPAEVAEKQQLPSFLYLPSDHDLGAAETALPWNEQQRLVVGELARTQGTQISNRMIASAKSWLCHAGVDRAAPILPWGAGDEIPQMSPVTASAMLLRHLQEAWDHTHQHRDDSLFADQEIMVTVPASFDDAARELTLAAAATAGANDMVLLEEPQAAFYAWIEDHPAGSRKSLLAAGDTILVFDIGGGTTDFTLIQVTSDGESFERTAVGDHLLLGGDNIDLALAVAVEKRLASAGVSKLDTLQWQSLVQTSRIAKERLLTADHVDSVPVHIASSGSKLIGKSLKESISRKELQSILEEGFFPHVAKHSTPKMTRSGLQEFGLPYASDPGITRHLASFLTRHGVHNVDVILFNGGAMTPPSLRTRIVSQISAWQNSPCKELTNSSPAIAVAKGAAYYGLVRRGFGSRIRGGTPRSYYVGVESSSQDNGSPNLMAMCLAGKGLEEGSTLRLAHDFELLCNRPVSFKLFSSSTRTDKPGDSIAPDLDDSGLLELPPIVTVLRAPGRSKTTVQLEIRITELSSLEIWCIESKFEPQENGERWRLSFDMRTGGSTQKQSGPNLPDEIEPAQELLRASFHGDGGVTPPKITKELEKTLGYRRDEWSTNTARALFDTLLTVEDTRKKSPDFESRWLNLCGFCLRPGRGAPLDEWRVKQMWRVFNRGLAHEKQESCRLAWWILWRRISGGMAHGQQEQIYDRIAQLFLPGKQKKKRWHQINPTKQETEEMWRTLASLERISPANKVKLGDELVRRLESRKARNDFIHFWALGRIGGRVPLYGPLNAVVPMQHVHSWLESLLAHEWPDPERTAFPMAQLGRRTGDRTRDITEPLRQQLADRLRTTSGGARTATLVEEIVELEAREERVALGDSLPTGLRLVGDDS